MPVNIEIKARARHSHELHRRAAALSGKPGEVMQQEDVFFHSPHGRLKLRILAPDRGQLIYYERVDQAGPKRSDYHLVETSDPEDLKRVLEQAYGIRGVVRKTRTLYLVGQTRIHLDDVDGLGQFLELEVVLRPGQSDADGQAIAEDFMAKLGVDKLELVDGAYMDFLEQSS